MDWIIKLFTESTVAHAVVIYGLVIAIGIWLGKLKIFGISLGVTWVLFMGLLFSYLGVTVNKETEDFLRDFGLILFVYFNFIPLLFVKYKSSNFAIYQFAAGVD